MIKRIEDQLQSQDVDIELTDAAKTLLAKTGYDPALGARPLRRAIQRHVEDPLSEKILWKEFEAGDTIIVDVENNEHGDEVIGFRKAARTPDIPPLEMAGTAIRRRRRGRRSMQTSPHGATRRIKARGPAYAGPLHAVPALAVREPRLLEILIRRRFPVATGHDIHTMDGCPHES